MRLRRRKQRGIVLLVCLVMLVLFLLLGITFILTATQFSKSSKQYSAALVSRDDGFDAADDTLKCFLRGGPVPTAPMAFWNLGNLLYGNDSCRGKLTVDCAPLTAVGGQFVAITLGPDVGYQFSPISGYYSGCVMTMLDGPAAGQSRRIVDYNPTTATFFVETFNTSGLPKGTNLALINGRPFNGTGNGYNPATGRTDAVYTAATAPIARPYAFLPNLGYFQPDGATGYYIPGGMGGLDVGYVAPDYNHPYLAASESNPTSSAQIKPSWHDPALLNYWAVKAGVPVANLPVDLLRQTTFRPLTADHPKFTGSNPFYNSLTGPWDVDNDGDSRFDSIWIDPGFPVRRTADGRLYKVLTAMYIRDLDGRVNLNVHGSQDTVNPAYYDPVTGRFAGGTATSIFLPRGPGNGPLEINPAMMLSAGNPAEMADATAQMKKAIEGGQTVDINGNGTVDAAAGDRTELGRFGWVDLNTNGTIDVGEVGPGIPGVQDTLNSLLWMNLYGNVGAYATPWDIRGIGAISLTHRGQPAYFAMGGAGQWGDSVFEQAFSNTLSSSKNDRPFTCAELEPVLRQSDADAVGLPNRLPGLCPRVQGFRNDVTVVSMDVPVPVYTAPKQLRDVLRGNGEIARHLPDLLRARLIKEHMAVDGWTLPINAAQVTQVNSQVNGLIAARLLAPEMLAGLRFDVNRLLGNGLDDNNNGVVDEPAEALLVTPPELVYPAIVTNALPIGPIQTQFQNIPFDHNRDGVKNFADALARQDYARQLYVLLMLLADEGAFPNLVVENVTATQKQLLIAKRLAQFAINCVDYRDPDSIMTPFEYDINPFDTAGWSGNCDGIIHPDPSAGAGLAEATDPQRRVVWGCEAPMALLSESLNFHNIRTKDDSSVGGVGDTTYDQFGLPQGSSFFEVYGVADPHRWMRGANGVWGNVGDDDNNGVVDDISEAGFPGSDDVYTGSRDLCTNDGRLDLSRKDANGVAVWQIAISTPHLTGQVSQLLAARPDSTTLEPTKFNEFDLDPPIAIDRVVWFCDANLAAIPAAVMNQAEKNKVFFNRANTTNTPVYLAPGRYLVVGPRAMTPLGKLNDGAGTDSLQQIRLNVGGIPVDVRDVMAPGNSTMPITGTHIQAPQAIICAADRPSTWVGTNTPTTIGINISENLPSGTYYQEPADVAGFDNKYNPPLDIPFDDPNATTPTPASQLYSQGTNTFSNFRTAFLQRLADPTSPFHPVTNPYITVDFMPLDLTMFNGEAAQFDAAGTSGTVTLRGRERGSAPNFNIWAPATGALPANPVTAVGGTTSYFGHRLSHTLGFLNNTFNTGAAFSQCLTTADVAGDTTVGDPRTPFPWLTWFDRPYISPYELLMVPSSTPARLNFEFSNMVTNPGDPYTSFRQPYSHLLNFFHTSNLAGTGAQFGRIFDYLGVQSKYPECNLILNPLAFAGDDGAGLGKGSFRPPFNILSRYREPGRINLNTMFGPLVGSALANGTPMPSWASYVQSRRDYAATPTDSQFALDTSGTPKPSFFGNPFRSQSDWDLTPELPPTRREADVTLLRPDVPSGNSPLLAANTTEAYRNGQVHPYFRYQQLNRLGNLTTTRSNVFAVWITVGYFEVEPVAVDAAHPDGYALATELGIDTGEVRRHKSFYIVDRTIPFGFENGREYNSQNTILLKTRVE